MIDVSRTTVSYHINKLVECGHIKRFTIDMNPDLNLRPKGVRAMFDLCINGNKCSIVFSSITKWKEVVSAWSTSGDVDMRILIEAADQSIIEELREKLTRHPEVSSVKITMILKTWCERSSQIREMAPKEYLITRKELEAS